MSRGKAPPFKQRLEAAISAAKAAGAIRLKVHPDGSVELDLRAEGAEVNDFDAIPPTPRQSRKHIKE